MSLFPHMIALAAPLATQWLLLLGDERYSIWKDQNHQEDHLWSLDSSCRRSL